jgi:hypothetical protein
VGRLPTQEQSFELQSTKADELLVVSLKLPPGKYNSDLRIKDRARVIFDQGDITIRVGIGERKLESIAAGADKMVEGWLSSLTPSEREKLEPSMKPVAVTAGDYKGFEITDQKKGVYCCILTSKNRSFTGWLTFKEGSPIMPADMKAILATVVISEKRKPLAERR